MLYTRRKKISLDLCIARVCFSLTKISFPSEMHNSLGPRFSSAHTAWMFSSLFLSLYFHYSWGPIVPMLELSLLRTRERVWEKLFPSLTGAFPHHVAPRPTSMCVYIFSRREQHPRMEKPSSTSSRRCNEAEDAPLSRAPLHVHYVLRHCSQRSRLFYVCDNYSSRACAVDVNAGGLWVTSSHVLEYHVLFITCNSLLIRLKK